MATEVGIYVRQAGVWERANAGTPEGFSGPQVHSGSVFVNSSNVRTYASSVWNYCWVNIDGEINLLNYTCNDFDLSPYSLSAWFRFNNDGTIDRKNFGTVTDTYANWRTYDCGRDYEIKFEAASPGNYDEPLTTGSWLNLTNPAAGPYIVGASKSGIGFLNVSEVQDVRIREKVSAPAGGNDIGTMTSIISSEV